LRVSTTPGGSRWEPAWAGIPDEESLSALATAALSDDVRSAPAYSRTVDRLDRGERPFGFADRRELDEEITSLQADESGAAADVVVWIGETGKVGLRRGLLRLVLARERGDVAICARVERRHPAWERLRSELAFEVKRRGRLYQKVLHPDFELFPALQACRDRIQIVEPHLPKDLRTVLDLGASYGQFSRFLEDQGFRVTAAEESPSVIHLLRLIRDTMGYSFEIFPRDVRAFRPAEPIDVLWAMSVLHFFTKNEADQKSLIALHGRLRPKVVFFQPPGGNEYRGRGWYRIYEPDEFAELIREWCGLTRTEQLAMTELGRPIYKFS
jgi:SAM-dependent methyltransferase